jgi:hypothetical protein
MTEQATRNEDDSYTTEQRRLLETQKLELEKVGITKKYLSSLEKFAEQIEATSGRSSNVDGMREVVRSGQLPIAGVNRYESDEEEDNSTNELILVTEDLQYGHLNYFSRVIVGETLDDQVTHSNHPFTEEDVILLERHVHEQEHIGIDDISMP